MSTFRRMTKNPKTGEFEYAWWIDDLFGRHFYGVVFPSDDKGEKTAWKDIAYNPEQIKLETKITS